MCDDLWARRPTPPVNKVREERVKVAINLEYPEQTVIMCSNLTEKARSRLCNLLQQNLDIFAWTPADMTGVPRHIAKHWMTVRECWQTLKTLIKHVPRMVSITIASFDGGNIFGDARKLLDVPEAQKPEFPELPKDFPKPTFPDIPKPELPQIPKPVVPDVPKPEVPVIPKPINSKKIHRKLITC
ncbi:hypothetical protein Tco_1242565 [Tanacetum coccineum]